MYTVIGHIHAQFPVSVSENFIFCFFRFIHVLPHVCKCTICAWSLQKLQDAVGAPGPRVRDGCEPPWGTGDNGRPSGRVISALNC